MSFNRVRHRIFNWISGPREAAASSWPRDSIRGSAAKFEAGTAAQSRQQQDALHHRKILCRCRCAVRRRMENMR